MPSSEPSAEISRHHYRQSWRVSSPATLLMGTGNGRTATAMSVLIVVSNEKRVHSDWLGLLLLGKPFGTG